MLALDRSHPAGVVTAQDDEFDVGDFEEDDDYTEDDEEEEDYEYEEYDDYADTFDTNQSEVGGVAMSGSE